MNQLATVDMDTGEIVNDNGRQLPAHFKPQEAKAKQIAIDAGLQHAAAIGNMDAIERAAEVKVQHVADCVEWWKGNVRGDGRPAKNDCSTATVSVSEAEEIIGLRKHSISRWSKRLKDREKFKNQIAVAALKKAIGTSAESSQLVQQSISNEHYTPSKYIDAAIDAFSSWKRNSQKSARKTESSAISCGIRGWGGEGRHRRLPAMDRSFELARRRVHRRASAVFQLV